MSMSDNFSQNPFTTEIELSSVVLGGSVVSISDEFFAEAFHLLLTEPAKSLKGQFGPNGALYDGWETRRHNHTMIDQSAQLRCYRAIIKLGTTGTVKGFDIDTSHFNGNEGPEASVQSLYITKGEGSPEASDPRWTEVLPRVSLGPSARHFFTVPETQPVNYVKLNMYPDGGIARFRVYGNVVPIHPESPSEVFDLAHVFAGGRVVFTSDQHFGVGSNLILPGRGKDMSDGWETKRSRQPAHKDWVIIKLGATGHLSHVAIDTAHFKGNFPQYCELHAINIDSGVPPHSASHSPPPTCYPSSEKGAPTTKEDEWTLVLPQMRLGPHREHYFQVDGSGKGAFTHVRLTIFPDGGVKRIRVFGSRVPNSEVFIHSFDSAEPSNQVFIDVVAAEEVNSSRRKIPALPLTPEAFAAFGQVVQSYEDIFGAPRSVKITPANFGTATKYHKLSLLESSYPDKLSATSGISVYRCQPAKVLKVGTKREVILSALERHPYTNQAFLPMGHDKDNQYLVVVAKNGPDDRPDIGSLRAFVARANQGIVYNTSVWRKLNSYYKAPDSDGPRLCRDANR
ncbi:Allantoicase [Multifurca ochricompacta]|uniref:Allantoicase n=1 Tax=Multifurca ochricompacta TaxID=376703 RepID=A0AAD4M7U6_9AGAM|nr:Allantoicase [Multifurca ochricompacta]